MDARAAATKHRRLIRLLLQQFDYAAIGDLLELSRSIRRNVFDRTQDLIECMVQLDYPAPPLLLYRFDDETEPVDYLQVAYPAESPESIIPIYHRGKKTPLPMVRSDRELIPDVLRRWIEVLGTVIDASPGCRVIERAGGSLSAALPAASLPSDPPMVEARVPGTTRIEVVDDAWLGHAEIARIYGLDSEKLRKRLDRLRGKNHDCYREVAQGERKPREPMYLYKLNAVLPCIEALKASGGASGERPAKKS